MSSLRSSAMMNSTFGRAACPPRCAWTTFLAPLAHARRANTATITAVRRVMLLSSEHESLAMVYRQLRILGAWPDTIILAGDSDRPPSPQDLDGCNGWSWPQA